MKYLVSSLATKAHSKTTIAKYYHLRQGMVTDLYNKDLMYEMICLLGQVSTSWLLWHYRVITGNYTHFLLMN